jgi:hypothetical protein
LAVSVMKAKPRSTGTSKRRAASTRFMRPPYLPLGGDKLALSR